MSSGQANLRKKLLGSEWLDSLFYGYQLPLTGNEVYSNVGEEPSKHLDGMVVSMGRVLHIKRT